jgi:EpsI family protein
MTPVRRRALLAALLMGGTLAAAEAARPRHRLTDDLGTLDLELAFPVRFGEWQVDTRVPVQLVSPDLAQFIARIYSATLSRLYVNAQGDRIMLSVAYGGDQSDATRAHRPEVCYPAQGFDIVADGQALVDTAAGPLRVRRLVARTASRSEPLTYWVVVGTRTALSGTEQKLAQLSYGLRGVVPDGLLVRVSSLSADPAPAHALQARFITQMSQALSPAVQPRIIGAARA